MSKAQASSAGGDGVWISVDLVAHAQQLTILLNAVDCWPNGGIYSGPYAKEAVRRYEKMWLPMLAACATDEQRARLVPPLDIAWAWLVHRLSPAAYTRDCKVLFGKTLDVAQSVEYPKSHKCEYWPGPFGFTDGRAKGSPASYLTWVSHTRAVWAAAVKGSVKGVKYAPEPFFPPKPLDTLESRWSGVVHTSQLSVDLEASMGRQAAFLHSLLRPCYLERPFLQAAADRYSLFLQLHKEQPKLTLVPMMDIDLMWHTHMAVSSAYNKDCRVTFGSVFDHDDGIEDTKRNSAFDETKAAFERRFPYAGPYNPPPTQLIPAAARHPLESHLGPALLQLFMHPRDRATRSTIMKLQSANARVLDSGNTAGVETTAHAGGHAVYLTWLLGSYAAKVQKSLFSKMFRKPGSQRLAAVRKTVQCGLGFARFRKLPLDMHHPYWQQFKIRELPGWGMPMPGQQQPGLPAEGIPVDNRGMANGNGGLSYSRGFGNGYCYSCSQPLDRCVCGRQRYAPYDMAYLPMFLPMSMMYWGASGGAYPNDPDASAAAASAVGDAAGPAIGDSVGGDALADVAGSSAFNGDVGTVVGCDAAGWNDTSACAQWDGVAGDGTNGGGGGGGCGGTTCGGGGGGCGGGGGGCGGGGGGCGGG